MLKSKRTLTVSRSSQRSLGTLAASASTSSSIQQQNQKIQQHLKIQSSQSQRRRQESPGCGRRFCNLIRGMMWMAAICSLSLLLVAFPLTVEPSISSLLESFATEPLVCVTSSVETALAFGGQGDACSWTSCRQGCTGDVYKCVHVFVNVSLIPWRALASGFVNQSSGEPTVPTTTESSKRTGRAESEVVTVAAATGWAINWAIANSINTSRSRGRGGGRGGAKGVGTSLAMAKGRRESGPIQYTMYNDSDTGSKGRLLFDVATVISDLRQDGGLNGSAVDGLWDVADIPLMINVKGCGYPPNVDCSKFHRLVARKVGTLLPCYTNQHHRSVSLTPGTHPHSHITMAIFHNDPQMDQSVIFNFFILPLVVFVLSVAILCCWHIRCCRQRCTSLSSGCHRFCCCRHCLARTSSFTNSGTSLDHHRVNSARLDTSVKYWAAPTEETPANASVNRILLEPLHLTS